MPETERDLSARLRAAAVEAALEAGALVRAAFEAGRPAAEAKSGPHDLVTDCDREAERAIRASLARAVPGSSVLGEEGGLEGAGEVVWYVDPIDGTNNFAAGIPFFCVSVGAELRGRPVAAAIYDPVRSELFAADLAGATSDDAPLRSAGARADLEAVLATEFPGPRADAADGARFLELVRSFRTVRRLGSAALMLAYVAAGRIDVTFGAAAGPWDVAAGRLLVERAGGVYRERPDGRYLAHVAGFDVERSCLARLFP